MKKIGISIGALQSVYGETRALEICAESGFDAVDFNLKKYGRDEFPIYSDGDEAVIEYFSKLCYPVVSSCQISVYYVCKSC